MRRATPIVLTGDQRTELERLSRGRRVAVRLAQRASIVLLAAQGLENKQIGERLGIARQTAGLWRDRYAARGLAGIEKDAPRGGRKRRITDKQRAAVVRKTLHRKPEGQTHWSRSTMAKATGAERVNDRPDMEGVRPQATLGRDLQAVQRPAVFEKLNDIVGLYLAPPEHAIVLSCDEKSQVQALNRTQPGLPMKRGRAGTMTHDYKRNGTTTLFAALNVADGTVISRCQPRHRHQEWVAFLNEIKQNVEPGKQVHLICDNYATQKHPKVLA